MSAPIPASPRPRVSASSPFRVSASSSLLLYLGGTLVCLWLLAGVLLGLTDLRAEMRRLGLD